MNDYQFKLVRLQGDFLWRSHADTDEVFLVIAGELIVEPKVVEHISPRRRNAKR